MSKSIRDLIVYYDHIAWYYINTQWNNQALDFITPFLRNQWFWAPLYFFLAVFMPTRFGKKGLLWCVFFLFAFACSDQISAHWMKPYFHRIRPCNNPSFSGLIHILVPCGGGYSFPSSHAANHFSMGVFSAVTLSRFVKWIWPVALLWAFAVAYSQVYVGVHFPFDISFGGIIGVLCGFILGKLFNHYYGLVNEPKVSFVNE